MKVSLLISQEPMKKTKGKRKVFQEEELVSRRGYDVPLFVPHTPRGSWQRAKENENERRPKRPGEKDKIQNR